MVEAPSMVQQVRTRLGLTEGQVYTYAIGIVVALVAAFGAIPPTLQRHNPLRAPERSAGGLSVASGPAAPGPAVPDPGSTPPSLAPSSVTFQPVATGGSGGHVAEPPPEEPPEPSVGDVSVVADGPELARPEAVAAGPRGVYTASNDAGGSWVVHVPADGGPSRRHAVTEGAAGNVGLRGLVLDGAGRAWVTAADRAAVLVVDLERGTTTVAARVPDLPPCVAVVRQDLCEPSPIDDKPVPFGLAADPSGALFVADAGQGMVWRLAPGAGELKPWYGSDQFGSLTKAGGPTGLVALRDRVVVAVAASGPTGEAGVFEITRDVGAGGAPKALRRLVALPAGNDPRGVAVATDGTLFVSSAATGEIVAYSSSGTAVDWFGAGGSFGSARGVAFHGRSLLAATQAVDSRGANGVVSVYVGTEAA